MFDPEYRNEDGGRPAYNPAILLKIILFAYSKGTTSSREIEWCCKTNILFKALSCDTVPHFTTLASFVSSFPSQIEAVFEQVLLIRHHLQRHRELDGRDAGEAEQRQRTGQTIATLSEAADKIGEFLKKSEPRMGKGRVVKEVKSNITDNDSAKAGFCSCKTCISYIHAGHDHQQGHDSGL